MKKKLLLSALLATATLSVAGCGEKKEEKKEEQNQEQKVETKKLTCTMTDEDKTSTDTIKYTLTYDGDTYSKATVSISAKYKTEKDAKKEYEKVSKEVKNVNEGKGISANVQTSGTSVYTTYMFTVKDLDDKAKKTYEEAGLKEIDGKSYDDVKSLLEKASFKCQ